MKVKKLLRKMLVDTDYVKFMVQNGNKIEKTSVMTVGNAKNKYNHEFYSLEVKAIRPIHDELELPDFQVYLLIVIDGLSFNSF